MRRKTFSLLVQASKAYPSHEIISLIGEGPDKVIIKLGADPSPPGHQTPSTANFRVQMCNVMTTFAFVSSPLKGLGHGTEFKYFDKKGLIPKTFNFVHILSRDPVPLVSPGKKKRMQHAEKCRRRRKGGVYGTCARLPSALCCPLP
jgi:hypothetical protein